MTPSRVGGRFIVFLISDEGKREELE